MSKKKELLDILSKIADILEITGENVFKVRAYRNAVRSIENLADDIQNLVDNKKLTDIKGIGKNIASKIEEFYETGTINQFEKLMKQIPDGLLEIMNIQGLGSKKIKKLYELLNVTNIGELEYACNENRLVTLPGFGKKSQDKIFKNIQILKEHKNYFLLSTAYNAAEKFKEYLKNNQSFKSVVITGSLRRGKEIVKDIDILITSEKLNDINRKYILDYPDIKDIINNGDTKISVLLEMGINTDIRIIKPELYSFALNYFTGSKEHNTELRHLFKAKGYKLNEYGIFNKEEKGVKGITEESGIYKMLDYPYIIPERRETRDIDKMQSPPAAEIIKYEDVAGQVHCHTNFSDGDTTLEEYAEYIRKSEQMEYIIISDHSKAAYYANGLDENRLLEQFKSIDKINESYGKKILFKGIESDILKDGSLDLEDEILSKCDLVIGSVHSNFTMSKEDMTERLVKALNNEHLDILGHLTGRLLLARDPYQFDMERILSAASKQNKIIELNANPHRLDVDWRNGDMLRRKNIMISINVDAHSIEGLSNLRWGVMIARKMGYTKDMVLNAMSRSDFENFVNS